MKHRRPGADRVRGGRRGPARAAGFAVLILVLAVAAAIGGAAGARAVRQHIDAANRPPAAPTPSALARATDAPVAHPVSGPSAGAGTAGAAGPGSGAPEATPAGVAAALAPLLGAAALGPDVHAQVVDPVSGTVLFDRASADAAAPASTAKILVAAAALATRGPQYRIRTTVVAGPPGTVVLVGGGDPTLTAAGGRQPAAYPDAARIADLAAAARAALGTAAAGVTRVVVDDSVFSGPTVSPDWAAEDVPSDYASAVTAVLADGGRAAPADPIRSAEPDLAAGHSLAAALGVPAATVERGTAPPAARLLASVASAPVSELVEQMLGASDNVIAECLARQVALATGGTASFTGSADAVRAELTKLGADPGPGMRDGSGLAAGDRLSSAALTAVLRLVVTGPTTAVRGVIDALPVAGWSGTLADRFTDATSGSAAGLVRAKTGTLSGVSALAGTVHDAAGRLLVFAVIADRLGADAASTAAAEAALDAVAAGLASCGCA